jgi:hypothetical protein
MATKSKVARRPSGYVIYEGPSLLDGAPIVCVATLKSRNGKTGNMLQTWILRADVSPMAASRDGSDASICGSCIHRGKATHAAKGIAKERSCYVDISRAPTAVWNTYRKGRYPRAAGHIAIAAIGKGRKVRIGAYGDGSAVPSYVVDSLLSEAAGHTAYSHQSGNPSSSYDPARYMVSADTAEAAQAAWSTGARTFRVVTDLSEAIAGKEIPCPSLKGIHCIDCGLCNGNPKITTRNPSARVAKSIVIPVHGAGAANFVAA